MTETQSPVLEEVHAQPLRCLGPREQDIDRLIERLKRGRRPANRQGVSAEARAAVIKDIESMRKRVKTTDAAIHEAFRRGNTPLAHVLKSYANLGCNYDLRKLIAQDPRDGELREKPCPKCGRTVRFRTPRESGRH